VQPRCGTDLHDRVGGQCGVLADPQTGAQQHFHGDSHQWFAVGAGGAQQLRGRRVVERLGQRMVQPG
jgi:hypothetical protein